MRSLADEGVTILVSSHILSELQQVVDHVTIINRGRLLASGPVEQILGEGRGGVRLTVADPDRAEAVLTNGGLVVVRDHESMLVTGASEPAHITKLLADQGLYVSSLQPSANDLESAFLEITGEDGAPHAAASGATT
jgi:ABC-type multidrug transport system ATPase subunit